MKKEQSERRRGSEDKEGAVMMKKGKLRVSEDGLQGWKRGSEDEEGAMRTKKEQWEGRKRLDHRIADFLIWNIFKLAPFPDVRVSCCLVSFSSSPLPCVRKCFHPDLLFCLSRSNFSRCFFFSWNEMRCKTGDLRKRLERGCGFVFAFWKFWPRRISWRNTSKENPAEARLKFKNYP